VAIEYPVTRSEEIAGADGGRCSGHAQSPAFYDVVARTNWRGSERELSPERCKSLDWQVWIESGEVLGFRLSTSHGSILPRRVQNRLPGHQSEGEWSEANGQA
jgi:hypothetical protein